MDTLNHTHDPAALSWVPGAQGHQDFPLQNLPVAVFRRQGEEEAFRGGMASSSTRAILMPPPVEPAQVAKQHKNSMSAGAKAGHCA